MNIMKQLIISLICLLASPILAMEDNNATSPDMNSTTPCTNYTLAKKSRGDILVLYLAAPIVPSLLVSHLAIRAREWIKAERAKKKKKKQKIIGLLYKSEYVAADRVRKSKICTPLFGISQKEFEELIHEANRARDIRWEVQKKAIQAQTHAIEKRKSVNKKSKDDLKSKSIAPTFSTIPENTKLEKVSRKKQKT